MLEIEHEIEGVFKSSQVSRDSKLIVGGCDDKTVKIFSADTRELISTVTGFPDKVIKMDLSADSRFLVVQCSWDTLENTIQVWELPSSQNGGEASKKMSLTMPVERYWRDAHISPDNKKLAMSHDDEPITLWSVETGEKLRTFDSHNGGVRNIVWSPDSELIMTASQDGNMVLWNANYGMTAIIDPIRSPLGHHDMVMCMKFSSKSTMLVSGGADKKVLIWTLPDMKARGSRIQPRARILEGHQGMVMAVCLSPDEKTLVSWCDEGNVRVWDVATGRQTRVLLEAPHVHGVLWSRDGRHVKNLICQSCKALVLWSIGKVCFLDVVHVSQILWACAMFERLPLCLSTCMHAFACTDVFRLPLSVAVTSIISHVQVWSRP
jgi:WD40 repeat protein